MRSNAVFNVTEYMLLSGVLGIHLHTNEVNLKSFKYSTYIITVAIIKQK